MTTAASSHITLLLVLLLFVVMTARSSAWSMPRMGGALSLTSHVGAAVSASAELYEDIESVGHAHGMLLLCGSRVCRELNVLREAVSGEMEDLEGGSSSCRTLLMIKPIHTLLGLLSSKAVTVSLAVAALAAAFLEVVEDASPGGHHGAVLLALNELLELFEAARITKMPRILTSRYFRLVLVLGATLFASVEMISDMITKTTKLGGHHGVLVLAFSKTLRCVGLLREQLNENRKEKIA